MDADLLLRARQGDEEAFSGLVDLHREPVFRLAYLMLRDSDEAQDVVQETFLRAHRALERFDQDRPLQPWLLRICANLCRNKRRDASRYWRALQRFAGEPSDSFVSSEQRIIQSEVVDAVLAALQHLRKREQEIIYLRFFLELSIEDTAAALDVKPGTVKSRLNRAVGALKGVLQNQYPDIMRE